MELVVQFPTRDSTQVLLCLWHFLHSVGPHTVSSFHIYTFVVSGAFIAGATSQAGDADSSRAPGLTSDLRESLNVHLGALLFVPQSQCISSFCILHFNIPRLMSVDLIKKISSHIRIIYISKWVSLLVEVTEGLFSQDKKEEIWLSHMTKAYKPIKTQQIKVTNCTPSTFFDYTTIFGKPRKVSYSEHSHPTYLVKSVYRIPTSELPANAVKLKGQPFKNL